MELSSSTREKIEEIPEEIIVEFLLRLPVKTLSRFKSVCKTWCNLITSPTFKSMHHNLGAVAQTILCIKYKQEEGVSLCFRSNDKLMSVVSPDLEIPTVHGHFRVNVVGSCNGIVCYYWYHYSSTIFLCNPATREFRQLPPSSFPLEKMFWRLPGIDVGFGFDSSDIYDFKVIRVFRVEKKLKAEMFTLSSNTWRQLQWGHLSDTLELSDYDACVLFCTNSFHFLTWHSRVEQYVIACCDIRTERFKTMDFPLKQEDDEEYFRKLMAFKGYLSSVYVYHTSRENSMDIWVMKDYGVVESWTKLYKIKSYMSFPICFWMDGCHLLLMKYYTGKLVTCHLSSLDGTLDTKSVGILCNIYNFSQVVDVHKETLVSIM